MSSTDLPTPPNLRAEIQAAIDSWYAQQRELYGENWEEILRKKMEEAFTRNQEEK